MVNIRKNDSKSVSGLTEIGEGTDLRLNWNSVGLEYFCVLRADQEVGVNLTGEQAPRILKILNGMAERLQDNATEHADNLWIHIISFRRLRQDGGVALNGEPGYYAVYGMERQDGQNITIYADDRYMQSNFIQIRRDVKIEDTPYRVQQGLFRKRMVYSGYHRISVKERQPNLGGVLKYCVGPYIYPFPDEIVANGGSFYVKLEENETVQIVQEKEWLNIQLQRKEE